MASESEVMPVESHEMFSRRKVLAMVRVGGPGFGTCTPAPVR